MAIIDVVKFNGIPHRDWLVYRYPGESFVFGTQLVVGEGQIAVFAEGGKATDYFTAGTYTINTKNIPILQSLINIPFGGRTPFKAELFFINKTAKLDILWGTSDPITLIDPKYNVRLRVRAFGQFAIRISDYRVFLTEIIGVLGSDEVVKYDLITNYFKGAIVTKVKTIISSIIINEKISTLEIAPRMEEISELSKQSISGDFERFGVEIVNFYISSINFPDEDFETINKILGEKAAFDIIGDGRYNVKRSFDVMETAAANESGGNLISGGIGLGVGAGAGMAIGNTFANTAAESIKPEAKTIGCKKCGFSAPDGSAFCPNCGESLKVTKINCYSCDSLVEEGMKFCPSCGNSMLKKICPNCKLENANNAKFCFECGTNLEG